MIIRKRFNAFNFLLPLSITAMCLTACGDGSPSKSDIEGAMKVGAAAMSMMLGGSSDVHVIDKTCEKLNGTTFKCHVTYTLGGQKKDGDGMFAKQNGQWAGGVMPS
ncbi:MAG: hypothetical protein ABF665_03295 [Gluconacetobacter sp.]